MTTAELTEELAILQHTKRNVKAEIRDLKGTIIGDREAISACRSAISNNRITIRGLKEEAKTLLTDIRDIQQLLEQSTKAA